MVKKTLKSTYHFNSWTHSTHLEINSYSCKIEQTRSNCLDRLSELSHGPTTPLLHPSNSATIILSTGCSTISSKPPIAPPPSHHTSLQTTVAPPKARGSNEPPELAPKKNLYDILLLFLDFCLLTPKYRRS